MKEYTSVYNQNGINIQKHDIHTHTHTHAVKRIVGSHVYIHVVLRQRAVPCHKHKYSQAPTYTIHIYYVQAHRSSNILVNRLKPKVNSIKNISCRLDVGINGKGSYIPSISVLLFLLLHLLTLEIFFS